MPRPRSLLCIALGVAAVAVAAPRAWTWMLRWGTSDVERAQPLPGDDVVAGATLVVTRALTIGARPSAIWPWLAQIGTGRAGFYSYDWLERLAGLDVQSADRIVPALQGLAPGDRVPLAPGTSLRVERADRDEALVLHTRMHPFTGRTYPDDAVAPSPCLEWTWAFVIRPCGVASRLLVRTRLRWTPRGLGAVVEPLLDPVWFAMERRMLLGIRERAERAHGAELAGA